MRLKLPLLLVLLVGLCAPAWAQAPGDVGTSECRVVQLAAQGSVQGVVSPPRNHGQLMKVVTRITSPELYKGNITEACSSCIVSQFARKVPISGQAACGPDLPPERPECAPATCATFIPCTQNEADPDVCAQPVCVSTAEGKGYCMEGATPCDGLAGCSSSSDCSTGEVCAVQTCCGRNVCVPADAFCPAPLP